ncbi:MAG TPA: biotin--[acetyl-CoA-carboxylase] ligase [Firmicutes bacterium]|nr:biotin--[acetyl-CoA-carboxylase] ligase [Bacillota bacterium]
MGTKEKLLMLFEEGKGTYFSGEEIAAKLSISRTAVWKAVNSLRNEGYEIDAVSNRGYCLSGNTDILSVQGIRKYLNPVCSTTELDVRLTVESTNALLREKAAADAPDGYTIIANAQTAGRGRLGRSFYSPSDTGIYMSLLLRPATLQPSQAVKLTTMAAVAACEAIEGLSEEKAWIKWVNDIYMNGKKVSGILTEGSLSLENGSMDYIILGIGFNLYPPKDGFPEELNPIAGAIFRECHDDGKNRLVAGFLNRFMAYYMAEGNADFADKYRERSFVIGKRVNVLFPGGSQKAVALDVDENCRLIVQFEDGRIERLSFGEISIRFSKGE